MTKQEISNIQIDLSKVNANGSKYFELFDRHIPKLTSDAVVLIYDISNLDCIARIIQKNPSARYVIYGNKYVNEALDILNDNKWNIECFESYNIYNIDMKFDCVIMNPPYGVNRNGESNYLHYYLTKIASNNLTSTGKCISLMPISLISSTSTKKELKTLKIEYSNICKSIEQVDQSIFTDTSMKEICIYECQLNSKNLINIKCDKLTANVSSLLDINYGISINEKNILKKLSTSTNISTTHGVYFYIRKKHRENSENIFNEWFESKKLKNKKYFIPINYANGKINATWQSKNLRELGIITRENLKTIVLANTKGKGFLAFTENEFNSCKNIYNLLLCNCLKFGLAKTQTDQNIQTKCYTYFPDIDYSNIDTEEKFYKHFNITEDEQKIIEETMAKYK